MKYPIALLHTGLSPVNIRTKMMQKPTSVLTMPMALYRVNSMRVLLGTYISLSMM